MLDFIKKFAQESSPMDMVEWPMFRVVKGPIVDASSIPDCSEAGTSSMSVPQVANIKEIVMRGQNFINGKIFELNITESNLKELDQYRYFKLKLSKLRYSPKQSYDCKLMLQIVDVTDTILYSQTSTQSNFTEISSTVISRELRSPLISLKGQTDEMENQLISYEVALQQVMNNKDLSKMTKMSLGDVFSTFKGIKEKVKSAAKHIEYFMHDIYDYTTLIKNPSQF